MFSFSLCNANKDQGSPIFLSGVSWDGQNDIRDAKRQTLSLQSSDVDIFAWWAGDNDDKWAGMASGIGDVCDAHACFIGEYNWSKSRTGHVRII
jgi:hypothetical protein